MLLAQGLGRKFKRDGGGPMLPHDLVMVAVYRRSSSSGSAGTASTPVRRCRRWISVASAVSRANTTLAACTGGLGAVFLMYFRMGKWDAGAITNGFLAGLVAITCPCYWVSPTARVFSARWLV